MEEVSQKTPSINPYIENILGKWFKNIIYVIIGGAVGATIGYLFGRNIK